MGLSVLGSPNADQALEAALRKELSSELTQVSHGGSPPPDPFHPLVEADKAICQLLKDAAAKEEAAEVRTSQVAQTCRQLKVRKTELEQQLAL